MSSAPRERGSSRGRRFHGSGRGMPGRGRGERTTPGGRGASGASYKMPVPRARTSESFSESANDCFVCCREIKIYAIGLCDHPVCFTCSTRLRVLCETNECPVCRASMDAVFFLQDILPFANIDEKRYTLKDDKYGITFENEQVLDDYKKLLSHECAECIRRSNISKRSGERSETPKPYETFEALVQHIERDHRRHFCDLCVEHLKLFTSERHTYSKGDLRRHNLEGDIDDQSHRGHARCDFCNNHYLDKDELYRHLRVDHFSCFLCKDKYAETRVVQYYDTYDHLREHLGKEHFLCEIGQCRTKRFVAFATDLENKAHFAAEHAGDLGREEQRAARAVTLDFGLPQGRTLFDSDGRMTRESRPRRNNERDSRRQERPASPLEAAERPPSPSPEVDMASTTDFPSLLGNSGGAISRPFIATPQYGKLSSVNKTQEDFPSLGAPSKPVGLGANWGKGKTPAAQTHQFPVKAGFNKMKSRPAEASRPSPQPPPSGGDVFPSLPQSGSGSDFGQVLKPLPKKHLKQMAIRISSNGNQNSAPMAKKGPAKKPLIQRPRVQQPAEEESDDEKEVYDPVSALADNLSKIQTAQTKSDRKKEKVVEARPKTKNEEFPSLGPASAKIKPMEKFVVKPKYKGLKPGQASESKKSAGEFIQPPHYTKRSNELMGLIKLLLDGTPEQLTEYRSLVSDLKKEEITAFEFVQECLQLFEDGGEFTKIFPEIVFLLPEISIQNELITLHDDLRKRFLNCDTSGRRTKEWSKCSDCGQILAHEDAQSHSRSH